MRILADFHHHALAESLAQLFEDRFGHELFFPAGLEWFDRGVWQFERKWHGDAVARQYLEGIWTDAEDAGDGTLLRRDPRHPGRVNRGISYEAARSSRWDIVLSSLPDNDPGYAAFAAETGARFGVQIGNNHQTSDLALADFILASSTLPGREEETADPLTWGEIISHHGLPTVVYHQSFDLETFRRGDPVEARRRTVSSFVNCFPETPVYGAFLELARRWRGEADWKVYGSYGSAAKDELSAGDISLVPDVAEAMRASRIGWHTKYWGDGYGHVIHNWFAVGRPVIGSMRYYKDKLAGALFVEGVTSWDVDRYNDEELLRILRRLRDDDAWYAEVCAASAARFRELVDFRAEEDAIGRMLGL